LICLYHFKVAMIDLTNVINWGDTCCLYKTNKLWRRYYL